MVYLPGPTRLPESLKSKGFTKVELLLTRFQHLDQPFQHLYLQRCPVHRARWRGVMAWSRLVHASRGCCVGQSHGLRAFIMLLGDMFNIYEILDNQLDLHFK